MALWSPSARSQGIEPSALREILRVVDRPGMLSLAGGLPSPELFPAEALRAACDRVLSTKASAALQYGASNGVPALREWIAQRMSRWGPKVDPAHVLITTGSQQGLDLLGKAFIDPGATVAVESPTYLGALQAFAFGQPRLVAVRSDDEGPLPQDVLALQGGRLLYLTPNFQNPTGRVMTEPRREAVVAAAAKAGVPIVEDDPYGALWFDEPPPAPLWARWPQGVAYLGSFSKTVAPGLRIGWLVAPPAVIQRVLVAKQASDLHTATFNQQVLLDLLVNGVLDERLPEIRRRYRVQRDALQSALQRHMPPGSAWHVPAGGMFFWVHGPTGWDSDARFADATRRGVAFVPGAAFAVGDAGAWRRAMRLSFVTLQPLQIDEAVQRLVND